jgi:hypothetical protein
MFYLPDLSFARRVSSICLIRLAFLTLALCPAQLACANVYATNIRIQGSVSNATSGTTVSLPCGRWGSRSAHRTSQCRGGGNFQVNVL